MPGLTAKVFRTFNASITLDDKVRICLFIWKSLNSHSLGKIEKRLFTNSIFLHKIAYILSLDFDIFIIIDFEMGTLHRMIWIQGFVKFLKINTLHSQDTLTMIHTHYNPSKFFLFQPSFLSSQDPTLDQNIQNSFRIPHAIPQTYCTIVILLLILKMMYLWNAMINPLHYSRYIS